MRSFNRNILIEDTYIHIRQQRYIFKDLNLLDFRLLLLILAISRPFSLRTANVSSSSSVLQHLSHRLKLVKISALVGLPSILVDIVSLAASIQSVLHSPRVEQLKHRKKQFSHYWGWSKVCLRPNFLLVHEYNKKVWVPRLLYLLSINQYQPQKLLLEGAYSEGETQEDRWLDSERRLTFSFICTWEINPGFWVSCCVFRHCKVIVREGRKLF